MELQTKQPPELEFSMPEVEESLTAYLSAIGGAVIGLLLTLLVLAIWNGGTLNFTNTSKVNALQAGLTRVNTDLETVNTSVDTLGERLVVLEQEAGAVAALQNSLATLDSSLTTLDSSLSDQGIHIDELDTAVADLQVTRRNFDLFTAALTQALAEMQATNAPPAEAAPVDLSPAEQPTQRSEAAPAVADPVPVKASATGADDAKGAELNGSSTAGEGSSAPPEGAEQLPTAAAAPTIIVSEEVAPDAVLVYLFVDVNADGAFDSDENLIAGATVTLTAPNGDSLMMAENTVDTAGILYAELPSGAYTVTVEGTRGYALASDNSVTVNVNHEAEAGQIIYFAVVTSSGE